MGENVLFFLKENEKEIQFTIVVLMIIFTFFFSSFHCFLNVEKYDQHILSAKQSIYSNVAIGSTKSSITSPVTANVVMNNKAGAKNDPFVLGSITQIINKKYGLPQDYEPSDLVKNELPGMRDTYLRKEAADALKQLFGEAKAQGLDLQCCSGYRDYLTQVSLFNQEVAMYGKAMAESESAPPGFSEHQSGLCIDLTSNSVGMDLTEDFINTAEGKWLDQNAWRFGFIVRYPKGKEAITGYRYEPWHIRYLGKSLAKSVYESGKCYEEYLNVVN